MMRWWKESAGAERWLELVLRVGVAGCFVGHGAFGVIGKEAWLPYFAVFGIGPEWAWRLMPLVGSVDIAVGIVAFVSPRPAVLAYAAVWATMTALLRPLAGESFFETLERAGNYGIPLAFLVAAGFGVRRAGLRDWFAPVRVLPFTADRRRRLWVVLRATAALLLIGHGGLAIYGKPLLARHLSAVGGPADLLSLVGWGEVLLGVSIAAHPSALLLVAALVWKVGTESLFPLTGDPVWEFIERAGSYAAPLALLVMLPALPGRQPRKARVASRALTLLAVAALAAGGLTGFGVTAWTGAPAGLGLPARTAPVTAQPRPATVPPAPTAAPRTPTAVPAAPVEVRKPVPGSMSATLAAAVPAETHPGHIAARSPVPAFLSAEIAGAVPARGESDPWAGPELLAKLRAGELVLACRHAITDRSRGDARRVDYDDPSTQRVLSEEGRDQARRLGRALVELGAPIGDVLSSPFARTWDSAELGFGKVRRSDALVYGSDSEQRRERRRLLSEPTDGGNRVLMTHQGILYGLFPRVERGSIREGDCVVVEPRGSGRFQVLDRLGPEGFAALDGADGDSTLFAQVPAFPAGG